jgi:hypothetical protein
MAKGAFPARSLARVGIVLAGALALNAPAMAARHGHPALKFGPCHVRGSKLLLGDSSVELVRGPPLRGFYGLPRSKWKIYSCARHGSAHFLLATGNVDTHTEQSIDHITLAGEFGAFGVLSGSIQTDIFGQVRVIDLATGRLVAHDVRSETYDSQLTALVLDDPGTAAWTYSSTVDPTGNPYPAGQPGPPVTLWGASTTHAATMLDTGAIDPAAVAVEGPTVNWTNAGAQMQDDLGN